MLYAVMFMVNVAINHVTYTFIGGQKLKLTKDDSGA
jgi:hypothetical protein